MDEESSAILSRLRWPLYFLAAGLILIPFLDFATSILPIDKGSLRWRWSSVGLFSGFLFTPLFAIMLVCLIAALIQDRVAQRIVAIFNLLMTVGLIALVLLFAFDGIQLRNDVPVTDRLPFDMSTVRALAKYCFFIPAFLWLGIQGFRVSKAPRQSSRSSRREVAPLMTRGSQ